MINGLLLLAFMVKKGDRQRLRLFIDPIPWRSQALFGDNRSAVERLDRAMIVGENSAERLDLLLG